MILPRKKTRNEIEREFDELEDAHSRSVDEWIRSRFGDPVPAGEGHGALSCPRASES